MSRGGVKWILDGRARQLGLCATDCIRALAAAGRQQTVEFVNVEDAAAAERLFGTAICDLVSARNDYDRVVLATDPGRWPDLSGLEPRAGLIGMADSEACGWPHQWVEAANSVAEVWTPSRWGHDVLVAAGVTTPVRVVVPCDSTLADAVTPPEIEALPEEAKLFYATLDWDEPSNPADLLAAFWSAFSGKRDVALVLATADLPGRDHGYVRQRIRDLRVEMNLPHFPRLIPVSGLPAAAMDGVHGCAGCYVTVRRSGSWPRAARLAASTGNPVIAPRFGAMQEALPGAADRLVAASMCPVGGLDDNAPYDATLTWAQPDLGQVIDQMKAVYHGNRADRREPDRRPTSDDLVEALEHALD